jgi:hypothetical protein
MTADKRRRALFASSCGHCGKRTEDGAAYCPKCAPIYAAPVRTEAQRREAQPWREEYRTPEYRAARARRYVMARGLCESCRAELKGKLHPDGVRWEYDHVHGDLDVHTGRVRCLPCHHSKTAQDRRERAGQ